MELRQDFKELLESLNAHGVEYLVVGGYALAFHGHPRFTKDLDIYVKPDPANAERIMAALRDLGFGSVGLKVEDFTADDTIVQLGVPPGRVDIITSIAGVTWEVAWEGKASGTHGGVPVWFLGRAEFAANKLAIGRPQDLADVDAVGGDLPAPWRTLPRPHSDRPSKRPGKEPR